MSLGSDFDNISNLNASSQHIISQKIWNSDPDGLYTRWTDGFFSVLGDLGELMDTNAAEQERREKMFLNNDTIFKSFQGSDMADGYLVIISEIMAASNDLPGGFDHPAAKAFRGAGKTHEAVNGEGQRTSSFNRGAAIMELLKAHNESWMPAVLRSGAVEPTAGYTGAGSVFSGPTPNTSSSGAFKPKKNKWAKV